MLPFEIFTCKVIIAVGFLQINFIQLKDFPSIPRLPRFTHITYRIIYYLIDAKL